MQHLQTELHDRIVYCRVHASSINPADYKQRNGELKMLVTREMPVVFGFDFSGVITEVGSGVY